MEENKKKNAALKAAKVTTFVFEISMVFACATLGAAIGDVAGSKLCKRVFNM